MLKIFFAVILSLTCSGAVLGYCGPPRLICAEYAHSDVVVEAKLYQARHFFPRNKDKQDWYIYTLETVRTYKGTIDNEFRIREENDSGRAGFDWKKNESYLLFLRKSDDGTWWLYGCGNSDKLQKAKRTIEVIESLSNRKGGVVQGSISGLPPGRNRIDLRFEEKSGKQYSGKIDENGLFKIHLPVGHYRVRAVLDGWKFQRDEILSYEDPDDINIENGWCAQLVFEAKKESDRRK
jgi:hypothetical protein